MSTFASAVTLAVSRSPSSEVFYITCRRRCRHRGNPGGYIALTQPNTSSGPVYASGRLAEGVERVRPDDAPDPVAVPFGDNSGHRQVAGLTITDSLIYEDKKASYRARSRACWLQSELTCSCLPPAPGDGEGAVPCGLQGGRPRPAFAITPSSWRAPAARSRRRVGHRSRAVIRLAGLQAIRRRRPPGRQEPYAPQSCDHMTLVGLALAARRGEASGTAIKENLRTISNPPGPSSPPTDGCASWPRARRSLRGASGSCDFDAIGTLSRPSASTRSGKARSSKRRSSTPERMPPIAQYLFNGLVTGGILALPAVAFSVLWKLLRFPNFAVSTYLTIGAFAAFAVNHGAGWRIAWAWLFALAVTGTIAWAVDRVAFRPMRDRRPFALAIASIGVSSCSRTPSASSGARLPELRRPVTRALVWNGLRVGREQLAIRGDGGAPRMVQIFLDRTRRHRDARHCRQPVLDRVKGCHRAHRRPRDTRRRGARRRRRRLPRARQDHDPLLGTGLIIAVFAAAIPADRVAPGALWAPSSWGSQRR